MSWIGITATPIDLLLQNDSTFFYKDPDLNPEDNWRVVFQKHNQGITVGYQFQVNGKDDFSGKFLFDLSKLNDNTNFKSSISAARKRVNFHERDSVLNEFKRRIGQVRILSP